MPKPQRIRVPEQHRDALARLAKLDSEEWERIHEAFLGLDALDEHVFAKRATQIVPEIPLETADAVIEAVLSMSVSVANHSWTPSDLAQVIAASPDVDIINDERKSLQDRLSTLLTMPSLSLIAKAATVVGSHERVFHTARVLTDIRPIFPDDPAQRPVAATIIHTLRLDYFKARSDTEIYISMDREDLLKLSEEVDRALKKGAALEDLLQSANIPLHSLEE